MGILFVILAAPGFAADFFAGIVSLGIQFQKLDDFYFYRRHNGEMIHWETLAGKQKLSRPKKKPASSV